MRIRYWAAPKGNFGDDLNLWLWRELEPDLWDADDRIDFLGVGTIIDRTHSPDRLKVVLGSGTGYAAPPQGIAPDAGGWKIYGVRGPLTAAAIGVPETYALTDPAILVARLPRFKPPRTGETLFVPFWKSVDVGGWRSLCAEAGVSYLDPRDEAETVIARIGAASLVLAESMHAAIVADALRTPWIPVMTSPEISPFKWADWTQSMRLPFRPHVLGASCAWEAARNAALRLSTNRAVFDDQAFAANGSARQLDFSSTDQLQAEFGRIVQRGRQTARSRYSGLVDRLIRRRAAGVRDHRPDRYYAAALRRLDQVRRAPPNLSPDSTHAEKLDLASGALARLADDYRSGRLASAMT